METKLKAETPRRRRRTCQYQMSTFRWTPPMSA